MPRDDPSCILGAEAPSWLCLTASGYRAHDHGAIKLDDISTEERAALEAAEARKQAERKAVKNAERRERQAAATSRKAAEARLREEASQRWQQKRIREIEEEEQRIR